MYIETSYPRKQGDKARLISPTYPAVKGGQCFQFWYHMYGQDIGTLNVYVKSPSGKPGVPVWLRSGDRGNIWKIAQVAVTSSSNFQVGAFFAETIMNHLLLFKQRLLFVYNIKLLELGNREIYGHQMGEVSVRSLDSALKANQA